MITNTPTTLTEQYQGYTVSETVSSHMNSIKAIQYQRQYQGYTVSETVSRHMNSIKAIQYQRQYQGT